jgi:hypothetical protein
VATSAAGVDVIWNPLSHTASRISLVASDAAATPTKRVKRTPTLVRSFITRRF